MPGRVYNRFRILLAEKQTEENRNISYDEVKEKTGVAKSTISAWATNKVKRYDAGTIKEFCDFLNCDVGDLIVYQRER